ncbi:metal-sensitive transcriptional regulator [Brevibacterium gallinarum]|uniref:Metal-sensitive transcriptional regulator n=1 Tax=Brevibacterium gallinarum TaxID=2762220 RepID=A0ABR8WVI5_9MICO|nr:metal-sensitive transcriptional regulator [Brevibacterium gallinarum]MBD8020741.1 metal-sensitive transcriptional regulator [Brevibacterium gallinarum]NUL59427.1 metal-sensitive transcriptional regulator [Brevibacterium luteolum]
MQVNTETLKPAINRLKRANGQLAAVIRMVEEGNECQDVINQLAAVSSAVDRAGFAIIADTLHHCIAEGGADVDVRELEKMFLSLA